MREPKSIVTLEEVLRRCKVSWGQFGQIIEEMSIATVEQSIKEIEEFLYKQSIGWGDFGYVIEEGRQQIKERGYVRRTEIREHYTTNL